MSTPTRLSVAAVHIPLTRVIREASEAMALHGRPAGASMSVWQTGAVDHLVTAIDVAIDFAADTPVTPATVREAVAKAANRWIDRYAQVEAVNR